MTVPGGARFDDLDDPSPPAPGSSHRVAVDRGVRRYRHRRQLMVSGLAVAIVFGATLTAVNLRNPPPATTALEAAPSAAPNQMYWPSAGSPGLGSAPQALSPLGPSSQAQGDATAATTNGAAGSAAGGSGSNPFAASPPSLPGETAVAPPCAAPTWAEGSYCGPAPGPGNGDGPGGRCSGHEAAAPCGRGVLVGTYYAYTLPVRCDGLITFDGRRWQSNLLPPGNGPDLWVWMRLGSDGHLRMVSRDGTLGFTPLRGAPTTCGGSP
jgi:hypothetical protein